MKHYFFILLMLISENLFAADENPCKENLQQGLMLIMNALAPQMIGIPIYSDDFQTLIVDKTKSGDFVLSVSGLLSHAPQKIAVHGLLECNSQTGEYEFIGAGSSCQ